jgi:glutamate-1-semialdehyde aminotransferase
VNDDLATNGSHIVDPLCIAAGTATVKNCEDHLNLNETDEQEKIVDKEIQGTCNEDNIEIDVDDQAYHNAGTMRFKSKKRGSNNTDLDSIEHLSDEEEDSRKHEEDDIDSVRINMKL